LCEPLGELPERFGGELLRRERIARVRVQEAPPEAAATG